MLDPHRAPVADPHVLLDLLGQLRDVELAHCGEVLRDALTAIRIGLAQNAVDERLPRIDAPEVAAASHEQSLLEPSLECAVAGLDVPIPSGDTQNRPVGDA